MTIEIIITSDSSGLCLYTLFSLTGSAIVTFSALGIMLAVFEQPEMDYSKTRAESIWFSTNNFFNVTCVQV